MSDLIFVRHAETEMAGTFCGHADPPVNAAGHRQIEAMLEGLAAVPCDAVYCSDLRRARETAEAVAKFYGVPCVERTGLREIGFGAWEGLGWEQIEALDAEFAARWIAEYPHLAAPGGETFRSFQERVARELAFLLQESEQRRIVAVTHAGVMRTVLQMHDFTTEEQAWACTQTYCSFVRYAPASSSTEVLPVPQGEQR